jgi:glycosyltransferase involved in cell wall biosynthesis
MPWRLSPLGLPCQTRVYVSPLPSLVLDARTATDHFPGIGRYVVNLAHALAQVAPELGVTLLHDPSAAATRLTLPDLPRVACVASPFSLRQQWIVPGQLRRMQAALYHSPYYLMPYWTGVPTVLTCYDLIPLLYPQYYSSLQRLIFWLAHSLALKVSSQVLAISHATRADLVQRFHVDSRRVVVTQLAPDPAFHPRPAEEIVALRARLGLPEKYVLYLGSNKPHKNLVRLVKAWQISNLPGPRGAPVPAPQVRAAGADKSQISNPRLVIAGHWDSRYPEARQVVENAGLKDRVVFAGPVAEGDLPALYSGATLFVFPSLYEGFGLPVLEAMACGVPVVCSNTSSLPELAGDAALLADPSDVDALAATMSQALAGEDLRQEMRQKGMAQAARFSWERTARETLVVYNQIVRGNQ